MRREIYMSGEKRSPMPRKTSDAGEKDCMASIGAVQRTRGHGIQVALILWRGACTVVALGVLAVLLWQIGRGIRSVRRGEEKMGTWLSGFGAWLTGREKGAAGTDATPQESHSGKMDPDSQNIGGSDSSSADIGEYAQGSAEWMKALLQKGEGLTEDILYRFDPDWVPAGFFGVLPADLRGGIIIGADSPFTVGDFSGQPTVLIVHSHSKEAYLSAGTLFLEQDSTACRSQVRECSVIGAGGWLRSTLLDAGISAVQWETVFDDPGVAGAFGRAESAVDAYLSYHPEVRVVIDLHRDAAMDEQGNLLRAVTLHKGHGVAQIRLGAFWGSQSWALACALHENMESQVAGINRTPTAQTEQEGWNWEQDDVFTLRVELGTAGNSPEEAARAAEVLAKALANVLLSSETDGLP